MRGSVSVTSWPKRGIEGQPDHASFALGEQTAQFETAESPHDGAVGGTRLSLVVRV